MVSLSKKGAQVFNGRDLNGNAISVDNAESAIWAAEMENAADLALQTLTGSLSGAIVKDSLSDLNSDLAHDADTMAWVVGDSTQGNDGVYQKQGASGEGSWTRLTDLPYNVIQLNNANAGTANAIQATTALNVPDAAYGSVLILNITAANTGAVTLSVNGEIAKPVVTNTNAAIASGYFVAGMAVLCIDDGTSYRLMSYGDASATQAAAEAAQTAAEAAQTAASGFVDALYDPQFDTIAIAQAFSPATAPNYIRTSGHTSAADGGGATYALVASEPSHSFKFSITLTDTSVKWYEFADSNPDMKALGAVGDGVTNETTLFENAVEFLRGRGEFFARVSSGSYALDRDAQIADIIFIGDGEFVGPDFDVVHAPFEGSMQLASGVRPADHLANFSRSASPKVAIAGDSISTDEPTFSVDETDSLWGQLQRKFRSDNPDKTITFYNRAIGATNWTKFNKTTGDAMGVTLPDWFTDPSTKSWLEHLEDLELDTLILAFGMNDADSFVTVQLKAVMSTIANWDKVPDVIFVTNMVPSRMTANTSISGSDEQSGRYFVAGYERQYAIYNGYGLIDLNRQQSISVAGLDPVESSFTRERNASSITLPHTETGYRCHDFSFSLDYTATASFWTSRRLRFRISQVGANSDSWLDVYDDGGFLAIELSDNDNVAGKYTQFTSTVSNPTSGSQTLNVTLKANVCRVMLGSDVVFEGKTLRHGGVFEPKIEWTDASTDGFTATFWQGHFNQYMPQLVDHQMWGDGVDPTGNDFNHPTSLGASVVYSQLLENLNLVADNSGASGVLRSQGALDALVDDAAIEIPTPFTDGVFYLFCSNTSVGGMVAFNAGSSPSVLYSQVGAATEIATAGTTLTGTTGNDTKLTISVLNGSIAIENRRGLSLSSIRYLFIGPA